MTMRERQILARFTAIQNENWEVAVYLEIIKQQ